MSEAEETGLSERFADFTRAKRAAPPRIVCLCGSTKFKEQFAEVTERETLAGRIVVSVGFFAHALSDEERRAKLTPVVKAALDELHLRKIDLADEVLALNVGGYLGASTRREVWYAAQREKRLRWFEPLMVRSREGLRAKTDEEALEWVDGFFAGWDEWHLAGQLAARG